MHSHGVLNFARNLLGPVCLSLCSRTCLGPCHPVRARRLLGRLSLWEGRRRGLLVPTVKVSVWESPFLPPWEGTKVTRERRREAGEVGGGGGNRGDGRWAPALLGVFPRPAGHRACQALSEPLHRSPAPRPWPLAA